jgi:hypothetical protein
MICDLLSDELAIRKTGVQNCTAWAVILCDLCIFVVFCLIVVPLPPGKNPSSAK